MIDVVATEAIVSFDTMTARCARRETDGSLIR